MAKDKDTLKAALKELKDARDALARIYVDTDDDPRYVAANRRVIEAEKNVPWWRR